MSRIDRQTDGQTDIQNCYINIAHQCADPRYKLTTAVVLVQQFPQHNTVTLAQL